MLVYRRIWKWDLGVCWLGAQQQCMMCSWGRELVGSWRILGRVDATAIFIVVEMGNFDWGTSDQGRL